MLGELPGVEIGCFATIAILYILLQCLFQADGVAVGAVVLAEPHELYQPGEFRLGHSAELRKGIKAPEKHFKLIVVISGALNIIGFQI